MTTLHHIPPAKKLTIRLGSPAFLEKAMAAYEKAVEATLADDKATVTEHMNDDEIENEISMELMMKVILIKVGESAGYYQKLS
ncbi:hypothetical protein EVAR_47056_1 [Eumeta japonica]|uniref:Uncharacterized protein n=1 Tax=Eumeta variegata TaxID=151549 RepID=A0A4C1WNJ4_EUMVA|nr:hypothetical protein EVAR_47056_1 [Eumeta japonica]